MEYNYIMEKKIWMKKVKFSQSDIEEQKYYLSLSSEERLNTLQELRDRQAKINNEDRKGLQRVLRTVKPT